MPLKLRLLLSRWMLATPPRSSHRKIWLLLLTKLLTQLPIRPKMLHKTFPKTLRSQFKRTSLLIWHQTAPLKRTYHKPKMLAKTWLSHQVHKSCSLRTTSLQMTPRFHNHMSKAIRPRSIPSRQLLIIRPRWLANLLKYLTLKRKSYKDISPTLYPTDSLLPHSVQALRRY